MTVSTDAAGPPAGWQRFAHVVIEGAIGVGKTSLARKLAQRLSAELVLEQPQDNPFLERFYADMPAHALQTQLSFLVQRAQQLRSAAHSGMFATHRVSDFMFDKDAIFARLTLSDDEHRLYAQIHALVAPRLVAPDLVIWLQAPTSVLVQRIRARAIAMEQSIDPDYLQRLCDAYALHFERYEAAPVFSVATQHFDPIGSESDFERLLQCVGGFTGRRGGLHAPGAPDWA